MTDYTDLKAKAEAATPGPLEVLGRYLALIAENERLRDNLVELQPLSEIARLREQLAEAHEALAAEEEAHDALAAAEAQLTEMREVMRKAEWQGEGGAWEAACCPWCGGGEPLSERDQPPIYGHSDDCEFVAALREETT